MAFPKPDPDAARLLEKSLQNAAAVLRPMFGCPAWFLGEQMFAGVFGSWINLRLPPGPAQQELMEAYPGAQLFEPFPGRVMKEHVSLPVAAVKDNPQWRAWLQRSLDYAAALPPKKKKAK